MMHAWRIPAVTIGLAATLALAGCGQPNSPTLVVPEQTAPMAVASSGDGYAVQQGPGWGGGRQFRCRRQLNMCLNRVYALYGPLRIRAQRNCYRQYQFCSRYTWRGGSWRGASAEE